MMSEENSEDIFTATWQCRKLFDRCLSTSNATHDQELEWLENAETEFKLWAFSIKADKAGHSSLDFRVRNRPDICKTTLDLIAGISAGLDEFLGRGKVPELAQKLKAMFFHYAFS